MKYYTQYYEKNIKSVDDEALSRDGIFILDGRNNLQTMIKDSIKLKAVRNFTKFSICKGDRFSNSIIIYTGPLTIFNELTYLNYKQILNKL